MGIIRIILKEFCNLGNSSEGYCYRGEGEGYDFKSWVEIDRSWCVVGVENG